MPSGPGILEVDNNSDQAATVTVEGSNLTIEVPDGLAVQVKGIGCTPVDEQPNVVRCRPVTLRPIQVVTFTTRPAVIPTESVDLAPGCNNVTLTWPDGTLIAEVVAAITPSSALVSIWRFDSPAQTFDGYAPQASRVNSLPEVNCGAVVFICMDAPGTLTRPAI